MGKHINSLEQLLVKRIRAKGAGAVFTPAAFFDLGNRAAIDQTLSRCVRAGIIQRIGRGLYEKPRMHPKLGRLAPSAEIVAKAVTQQAKALLLPSGAHAANLLGLTEQVPTKIVYLTDAGNRRIRMGKTIIVLKHVSPQTLRTKSHISALVIQAFRYLGRRRVDEEMVSRLRQKLPPRDRKLLIPDARHAPGWIADLFHRLAADIPIKIGTYDAVSIRREKGRDRRAIQQASPSQRVVMQASHSLVGGNKSDLSFEISKATVGFY